VKQNTDQGLKSNLGSLHFLVGGEDRYNLLKSIEQKFCFLMSGSNPGVFSILRPDWPFLFHSMKRKQKSRQNEPSAGRFDGPRTRFVQELSVIKETRFNCAD
jgi:hypothetical protein